MEDKIIVRSPNWVGDAVLSTPALSVLRGKHPKAHVSLLARRNVSDCFLNNPDVDEIITLPEKNDLSYWLKAFRLRRKKYDKAILFPNSFSSALFLRISGAEEILGYRRDGRGFLLTRAPEPTRKLLMEHQVNYYLHLIERLPDSAELDDIGTYIIKHKRVSGPEARMALVWVVTQEEKEEARKFLKENKVKSVDRLIGINPGATYGPAKRWFPRSFADVAVKLIDKYSAKILLFGTAQEEEITDEISRYMREKCVNASGKTTLRQLGALLSMCELLITNDSGAMHIATAVKTPVVAIFGSTDPVRTGPWGERHTVLYRKLNCSPCFARKCPHGHYRCFKEIQVREVLLAVEEKLRDVR